MDMIKDLLKGANPIIILILLYLVFQVTNHIPTQIKEVKTEIQEVRTELKTEIQEVNKKLDKIIFYLIDKDSTKLTNKNQ